MWMDWPYWTILAVKEKLLSLTNKRFYISNEITDVYYTCNFCQRTPPGPFALWGKRPHYMGHWSHLLLMNWLYWTFDRSKMSFPRRHLTFTVTIDENHLFSCFISVSVILTYMQTCLGLFKMHAGVFPLNFFTSIFGKSKPDSEIPSARTHRDFLKSRGRTEYNSEERSLVYFIFTLLLVSK